MGASQLGKSMTLDDIIRPLDEEGWSSSCCKLRDSSCFGIFRGSIFRTDLVIRLKGGRKSFFGPNWAQKLQNCPKSIFHEVLVIESWLTPQNDRKTWFTMGALRYVYPSENRKCPKKTFFCFWGLIMIKLIFHTSGTAGRITLVDPQKWPEEWIYYGRSKICIPLKQPEVPKNGLFLFFLGLIWRNFEIFYITRTKYQIKLADLSKWPKDPSFY